MNDSPDLVTTTTAQPASLAVQPLASHEALSPSFGGAASVLAFFLVATGVWFFGRRLTGAVRRRPIGRDYDADSQDVTDAGVFGNWTDALAAQIPESRRENQDFAKLLRSAGLYQPHAARSVYALRFVLMVTPLVVAGLMAIAADRVYTAPILIAGALVAATLSVLPRLYVYFRRRHRQERIAVALPDCVDMLSMCLGGGLGLSESLDYVARQLEIHPELAQELQLLRKQSEMGSLDAALADFAARVDLPEARQLVQMLLRHERLGTSLAGSLLGQADQLRTARRQTATQRANKAPVKLVLPLLFCFAPAAILILCGPAMIELKEFFAPTTGQSQISGRAAEGLGPGRVTSVLDELEQEIGTRP